MEKRKDRRGHSRGAYSEENRERHVSSMKEPGYPWKINKRTQPTYSMAEGGHIRLVARMSKDASKGSWLKKGT